MSEQVDETDERIAELLVRFEEAHSAGSPLTAAELCSECPELTDELDRQIQRMRYFDRFIDLSRRPDSGDVDNLQGQAVLHDRFPILPGFTFLKEIGRGGMGIVYQARQHSLGRLVSIKTLTGRPWGQSPFVARLRQEAKALSQLNHPNIVQVFDVIETPQSVSIVLEYIEGESLAARLTRGTLDPREAAQLTHTLACTLKAVHARGLLHRDIKPDNILIDTRGVVKVADFGLVKEVGAVDGPTATGDLWGSPNYMAPEQAEGRIRDIDVRTDIFASGTTLYTMLIGRPPFTGASTIETLDHVRHRDPVSLRLLNPFVPPDLETICLKCLEKDPRRRFQSMEELEQELARFLRGDPILSRPVSLLDRCLRWCRRRPTVAALSGLMMLALFMIAALLTANYRNVSAYNLELTRINQELSEAVALAKSQLQISEQQEQQAKDGMYAADISRAATAWRQEDTRELREILDRQIPKPGEPDRRGFEWWYLDRQATLKGRTLLDVASPQYFVCYSKDKSHLAAAGVDAILRILNLRSGAIEKEIRTGQIEVNGIAFSPDGKEVATAGDDGTVKIWNLETGIARLSFKAHSGKAYQILFSPDGTQLLSCGNEPIIRAFDAQSGSPLFNLEGHRDEVQSIVLIDNGNVLVSTSSDNTAKIWDLELKTLKDTFSTTDRVGPVAILPERNQLVIGNASGVVQVFDTKQRRELSAAKHFDRMGALALNPNGRILAAGDASGRIQLRDITLEGDLAEGSFQPWQAHVGNIYSLIWSADGTNLISAGHDGRVMSWNPEQIRRGKARSFEINSDGTFFLVPQNSTILTREFPTGIITQWDWKSGVQLARGIENCVLDSISADGNRIAWRDSNGTVNISRISVDREQPLDSSVLATWKPTDYTLVTKFSPHDQFLAVAEYQIDGNLKHVGHSISLLRLPNLDSAEQIPIPGATKCTFSPDGRTIALLTDFSLIHWEIEKRRVIWRASETSANSTAFSPDGKLIATGGDRRTLIVRNSSDGSIRFQRSSHRSIINFTFFSPDGRLIATIAADGSLKLWYVASGQELLSLEYPGGKILHAAFTEDGENLLCLLTPDAKTEPKKLVILDGSKSTH